MRKSITVQIITGALLAAPAAAHAGDIGETLGKVLGVSDSTYVREEIYNSYFNTYLFSRDQEFDFALSGGKQRLKLTPDYSPQMGVNIGWGMLAYGYSRGVNTLSGGKEKANSSFTFDILGNRLGIQFYTHRVKGDAHISSASGFNQYRTTDAAHFRWDGTDMTGGIPADLKGQHFDGFNSRETGIDFYYVFNFKHFSYKAAYGNSTRQLHSAGSIVTGLTYADFKSDLVMTHDPFMNLDAFDAWWSGSAATFDYVPCVTQEVDFRYRKVSAKLGYSYNWAFLPNCVFNVTLYPVLSLKWSKVTTYSLSALQKEQHVYSGDWSLDFKGQASVQWNNGKMYAGLVAMANTFSYDKPEVKMSQLYTEGQLCVGVYFDMFKKKRP